MKKFFKDIYPCIVTLIILGIMLINTGCVPGLGEFFMLIREIVK